MLQNNAHRSLGVDRPLQLCCVIQINEGIMQISSTRSLDIMHANAMQRTFLNEQNLNARQKRRHVVEHINI